MVCVRFVACMCAFVCVCDVKNEFVCSVYDVLCGVVWFVIVLLVCLCVVLPLFYFKCLCVLFVIVCVMLSG